MPKLDVVNKYFTKLRSVISSITPSSVYMSEHDAQSQVAAMASLPLLEELRYDKQKQNSTERSAEHILDELENAAHCIQHSFLGATTSTPKGIKFLQEVCCISIDETDTYIYIYLLVWFDSFYVRVSTMTAI